MELNLHQRPPALTCATTCMSSSKAELEEVEKTRERDFLTSRTSRWAAWGHCWSPLWLGIDRANAWEEGLE